MATPTCITEFFYFYYNLAPYLLFQASPSGIVLWNGVFNAAAVFVIYAFSLNLFRNKKIAIISALLMAFSYEFVQFSKWISSTTTTIFIIPLFYLALWKVYKKRESWLIVLAISLGIAIQSEIFFLYLIPLTLGFLYLTKHQFKNLRIVLLSGLSFVITISTLILTEFKLKFAGVKTLLNFSNTFDDSSISLPERFWLYAQDIWTKFVLNVSPLSSILGTALILIIIYFLIVSFKKSKIDKREKSGLLFLLFYFFSPLVMLLIGYHTQPWFLIAVPGVLVILLGYGITKISNNRIIYPLITLIIITNFIAIFKYRSDDQLIFKPEESLMLSNQLSVVEYTYKESGNKPFAIYTVTYPMYHNALWDYLYSWYGESNYDYIPGWLGLEQSYPYAILPKATEMETYYYLLIDNRYRVPLVFRNDGQGWIKSKGEVMAEKELGGFTVVKVLNKNVDLPEW